MTPKTNTRLRKTTSEIPSYASGRWACSLFGEQSEIEVFIAETGKWEKIATINCVANFDAEDIAAFIVQTVTEHQNALAGNRKSA